jgi:hypothetical protein
MYDAVRVRLAHASFPHSCTEVLNDVTKPLLGYNLNKGYIINV